MNRPSRLYLDICRAVSEGRMPCQFRVADIRKACPGRSEGTYTAFLAKHAVDNLGGNKEYCQRHKAGLYSLIERGERS